MEIGQPALGLPCARVLESRQPLLYLKLAGLMEWDKLNPLKMVIEVLEGGMLKTSRFDGMRQMEAFKNCHWSTGGGKGAFPKTKDVITKFEVPLCFSCIDIYHPVNQTSVVVLCSHSCEKNSEVTLAGCDFSIAITSAGLSKAGEGKTLDWWLPRFAWVWLMEPPSLGVCKSNGADLSVLLQGCLKLPQQGVEYSTGEIPK